MRNVLQQIRVLYPNDTLVVSMESGNNVSGRPGAVLPTSSSGATGGVFQLLNGSGAVQSTVSICRIAAVRVTSATYVSGSIEFLDTPTPTPEGCSADCQNAIRSYLLKGTTGVSIRAGGQTIAQGSVLENEYGMLLIGGSTGSNPTIVSICKTEIMTI